jgi:hypothetical protein
MFFKKRISKTLLKINSTEAKLRTEDFFSEVIFSSDFNIAQRHLQECAPNPRRLNDYLAF